MCSSCSKRKMPKFGDRNQVWEGECTMTRGGLTKDDLMVNKAGRIVSKKKSAAAKNTYTKYGFKKRVAPVAETVDEPKKKRRKRKKKIIKED